MKRILTMMTVVGTVALMASSAYAQNAGPRQGGQRGQGGMRQNPEFAKKMAEVHTKVMKQVGLTADQQKKVEAANKKQQEANQKMFAEMQKAREAGKQPDREKMQADRKKITDAHKAELVKVMGKEKHAQYEKLLRAEMQKLMEEMGMGRRGGDGQGRGGQGGGGQRRGGGTTGGGGL